MPSKVRFKLNPDSGEVEFSVPAGERFNVPYPMIEAIAETLREDPHSRASHVEKGIRVTLGTGDLDRLDGYIALTEQSISRNKAIADFVSEALETASDRALGVSDA